VRDAVQKGAEWDERVHMYDKTREKTHVCGYSEEDKGIGGI
jgi:hypothetical protein